MDKHQVKPDGDDNDGFLLVKKKKAAKRRKMVQTEDGKMKMVDVVMPPNERRREGLKRKFHGQRLPYNPPSKRARTLEGDEEIRKVPVFIHRIRALRENWLKIFTPLVEQLKLQVRFNTRTHNVELKASSDTKDKNALQKAADFVRAFALGFTVEDSLALLRLDDIFIEVFQIEDVKPLKGDHLGRAVGRIAGKSGKTKFTIENVTKTRIVMMNNKIHIMGSYQNIALARRSICSLILGSPPSKVFGSLQNLANRMKERF